MTRTPSLPLGARQEGLRLTGVSGGVVEAPREQRREERERDRHRKRDEGSGDEGR